MRSECDYVQWLMNVPGVGYLRCQKLLESYGSAEAVWEASESDLKERAVVENKIVQKIVSSRPTYSFLEQENFLKRHGIRVIHISDPDYPFLLQQIYDPPHILYVKGEFPPPDESRTMAVVGSRNPTNYGIMIANKLASQLAEQHITIVSGMARGIDMIAHEAALQTGTKTIAVLAGGILKAYPAYNHSLAERISRQGALISEFHPLATAHPGMFPIRNRIISGISRGVLVVEAARRSGSLITANHGLEQNREVFSVPGPITSPLSLGTNDLIRQGARLITGIDDIWEEFPDWKTNTCHIRTTPPEQLTLEERLVLESIGYGAAHLDQLLRVSQISKGELHRLLIEMEIKGYIKQMPGQLYMRAFV
ncbi:DNA-processing protein DprA [Effusibacillus lacus]|uniref:DNA protecting protein DprA n=1 Tax=Effusibacillus lacus TaxID=1348429 RepID=A0A292YR93_9BACL|nr:DNA-processing protein DprA [Effusibacillus lacus]TCS76044.1 DNA processing protein [Effusibacillus lacus]GAX91439.1 DNA protecting protein DprA [Effusibacillus lacus]